MTTHGHQRKMRSRTWGASLGGCSCAPIPADQQDCRGVFNSLATRPSKVNSRRFGVGLLIQFARLGFLSPAEHRRVGCCTSRRGRPVFLHSHAVHNGLHRLRVPAARGAVQFVRAVMAARRQTSRIELEPAKQSADPFHSLKRPFKRLVADDRQHDVKGLAVGQVIFGEKQNAFG